MIYDIFSLLAVQLGNYVNKARTSGCMYTPKDRRKTDGDMHNITNVDLLNFIHISTISAVVFLHFQLAIKQEFFSFHLDYIFMFMCSSKKQRTHAIDYPWRVRLYFFVHSSSRRSCSLRANGKDMFELKQWWKLKCVL